ncbi:SRPBCC domain-containing protein [Herbiconiux sp. CPCC 205763]|uniref:SRPBCC domain-containing protein n=1 Tax=Herbiconiux aconitum TaxID=2970913 RepID=A0ABT2GV61_9MICO|nr:SRPBCC domain-containing protein [Herbiconiux aconitum]MCS5720099.1 SRPBCC domain-containing protein [Herbiconiux aconitum]
MSAADAAPTPRATGHLAEGGPTSLAYERRFAATIAEIWAEVTESARLGRWLGTWTGDPASGRITFQMIAEGDVPAEEYRIRECSPPNRLVVDTALEPGPMTWHLTVELAEVVGGTDASTGSGSGTGPGPGPGPETILTFSHELENIADAVHYGSGWDYYLDRLVVAQAGGDASVVDWATYSPALDEHYARLGPRS